jgi:hypothetical protein
MATGATQMNFPLTTLHLTDATAGVVDISGSGISCPSIKPAVILDTTAVTPSSGTANQVLTAGPSGGSVVWADLPGAVTPSLADVMAVATAGDAGGQGLSNTPSVGLINTSVGVVLSAVVSSDVLNISTAADVSAATKEFSRNYLPISVAGVVYYLPLFSVPPP